MAAVVELNTNSAISVSLNKDFREIELLKARCSFTVAKDKDRPFIVDVAVQLFEQWEQRSIFIGSLIRSSIVSVTEGIVRVEEAGGSSVHCAVTVVNGR